MTIALSILFLIELVALYFISRISLDKLFRLLHSILPHKNFVYTIIACIYFPGTVIHELSHVIAALILFLPIYDIHIFPVWKGNHLILGRVYYEKKDVIRSILVGIAPIIVGILLFWWLYSSQILSNSNTTIQVFLIYFIFVLSSSMFSSKQDLIDIVYIIPVLLIVSAVMYVLRFDTSVILGNERVLAVLTDFLYAVTTYIGISIAIHIVAITAMSGALYFLNKR